MQKITLRIEGMMCGNCEAHMNDVVRNSLKIKKVTSSYTDKETIIICDNPIEEEKLRRIVSETGYELKGITIEPYEKKSIISTLFKR